MREELDIEGSPFEDLILCIVFYPNVAVQMEESLNDLGKFCLLGEFLLIRNCRKNIFCFAVSNQVPKLYRVTVREDSMEQHM